MTADPWADWPEILAAVPYGCCCTCHGTGLDDDRDTCRDCGGTGVDNHGA